MRTQQEIDVYSAKVARRKAKKEDQLYARYGRYADGMIDDAMAGKAFPVNFAEWRRREERIRGEQLTLEADELGSGADT